jgi:hypothetical protein
VATAVYGDKLPDFYSDVPNGARWSAVAFVQREQCKQLLLHRPLLERKEVEKVLPDFVLARIRETNLEWELTALPGPQLLITAEQLDSRLKVTCDCRTDRCHNGFEEQR